MAIAKVRFGSKADLAEGLEKGHDRTYAPDSSSTRNTNREADSSLYQCWLYDDNPCIVVVEDYELFDFIDDFLGDECDLPYESRTTKERSGGEIITMYFPPAVTLEAIERNLSKLSPEEMEQIYRLNN
ncbi:hypothetical protein [Massilia varians]|uniref:hypothetical protein n=1 Tax=Massilia varians TaxID=457921 RepID=UPI00255567FC|nr:hypothetical protein [Massilia varians]MDK6078810.1 hypothetical protein [Massilia varians]